MTEPDPPRPAEAPAGQSRRRWVAIITGALSVLVGVIYLVLITLLDSRGPMRPPPPEAFGIANAPPVSPSPVGAAVRAGVRQAPPGAVAAAAVAPAAGAPPPG